VLPAVGMSAAGHRLRVGPAQGLERSPYRAVRPGHGRGGGGARRDRHLAAVRGDGPGRLRRGDGAAAACGGLHGGGGPRRRAAGALPRCGRAHRGGAGYRRLPDGGGGDRRHQHARGAGDGASPGRALPRAGRARRRGRARLVLGLAYLRPAPVGRSGPAVSPRVREGAQVKDVQVVSASISQWLRRVSARSVAASAPATSSEVFSQDGSWIGEVKEPTRSATASVLVRSSAACCTISTSPTSRITTAIRPITLLAPGGRRPKRARRPSSERSCGRRGCGCPPSSGTKCIRDRPYMLVATSI